LPRDNAVAFEKMAPSPVHATVSFSKLASA